MKPIADIPGRIKIIQQVGSRKSSGHRVFAVVACPDCGARRQIERSDIIRNKSTLCPKCARQRERYGSGPMRMSYGPEWPLISKAIMMLDGNQCVFDMCYSKDLVVHHITPFRVTMDNSVRNLATVCHTHHMWCDRHLEESIPILMKMMPGILKARIERGKLLEEG